MRQSDELRYPARLRVVVQCVTEFRSHGVPLEQYEPTAGDRRAQQRLEDLRDWARAEAAKMPRWSDEQFSEIERLLRRARENPPPPQMRWYVRLFCGHILQVTRHADSETPTAHGSGSVVCSSCGGSVQLIVAFEPVEPVRTSDAPQPAKRARKGASSSGNPRTKAELEAENAALRAEVEGLRRPFDGASTARAEPT